MRIDRRVFLAGVGSAFLAASPVQAELADPPLLGSDYTAARSAFRTRLLTLGPAPDKGDPLDPPPAGAEIVNFRSGALSLHAWASAPVEGKRRPGLLLLHGGNALWTGHWDLAAPFLEDDYAVLMPAVRAENGQAGDFSGFYDETDDVLAAAEALARRPDVDPERLFVAGHSVGGTLTLLAALASDRFRAAAAFSPSPSAFTFFDHYPEDVRFDRTDRREFEMRSALCFASGFRCPLRLTHGSAEQRNAPNLRLTVERARSAGLDADLAEVAGDHTSALPGESALALAFFATL